MESAAVSGITVHREEAKISVLGGPDPTGIAHQILSALGNARVEVGLIIQNVSKDGKTDVSFTLHRKDCARTLDTLREKVLPASGAREVVGDTTICKVSIVDASMGSPLDVASRMFRVLSDEGIQIQMIATSDSGASVVIGEQHLDLAMRSLRRSFPTDQDAT